MLLLLFFTPYFRRSVVLTLGYTIVGQVADDPSNIEANRDLFADAIRRTQHDIHR